MTKLNEDYSIQSLKSRLDIFFNSLFIKHISQINLRRVVFYWQKYFLQAQKLIKVCFLPVFVIDCIKLFWLVWFFYRAEIFITCWQKPVDFVDANCGNWHLYRLLSV